MKILLQILMAVIVLAVAFGLFWLTPTPSDMMSGTSFFGLIFWPLAIALYVSIISFLGIASLNLIEFIFSLNNNTHSNYTYQPNLSQQIKTPSNPVDEEDDKQIVSPTEKERSLLFYTLSLSGIIAVSSFMLGLGVLFWFMYAVSSS